MTRPGILLIIIVTLASCVTQSILREPIETYSQTEILALADWRFQIDVVNQKPCDFYIIDGVPYRENKLDSIMVSLYKRDVRMISFLAKNDSLTWWNIDCQYLPIIQTTLIEQEREYKKEVLNSILDIYKKYDKEIKIAGTVCDYCPLIVIDNRALFNKKDVVPVISKLKLKNIDFIADYAVPHNPEYYGSMGKAGVIEIFTK